MLSMRSAASLLSAAATRNGLLAIVHAAGFTGEAVALPDDGIAALGLDVRHEPRVIAHGDLRILVVAAGGVSLRDDLQRVSRRLAARAPHIPWLLAASGSAHAALATIVPHPTPRVAAFLWETSSVVDSDAETLCALAAAVARGGDLVHVHCAEVLGRDALTRRFYRALHGRVGGLAASLPAHLARTDARHVALVYASRLLFLRFLEAKGWMDGDRAWLATRFDQCMRGGGGFHQRVLLPLFFGTLNTPFARRARAARALGRIPFLNGGLFARGAVERRATRCRFPDELLGALFDDVFQRYRFVAREDTATWSEASVDPEMLGRAFESLMAGDERRSGGVFYTPHALVARVADHAMATAFPHPTLSAVRDARVLDPACGSGAFLVHLLERLAAMRLALGERGTVSDVRRDVLARSVFGVDRDPTAVWLCELRLWLAVVIECDEPDPLRVPPLPNLDRNVRVGDALAGRGFGTDHVVVGSAHIERMRTAYARATGTRKLALGRALDRQERARVLAQVDRDIELAGHARRERLAAARARDLFGQRPTPDAGVRRDLKRLRDRLRSLRSDRRRIADGGALPFSFSAVFAEAQARGGFDVIVGNPPWVRVHRIPDELRRRLKESYEVFRAASWDAGAAGARASSGFASQVDLAALFVERAITLARDSGTVALLLPAKLWRSLAGGGVRRFVLAHAQLARLEDLSESRHAFDAAVYPSVLVARRGEHGRRAVAVAVHDRQGIRDWRVPVTELAFDGSPGAPWLLLRPEARAAFECLRRAGPPLSATAFGAPRLGVKSGCNAAFVVRVTDSSRDVATVRDADGETGSVELALLRPALRGDAVRPWTRDPCDEWIIWTHDERGAPLARLPARARAWLGRRYTTLVGRADATHARRWWSLFRTDAADHAAWRVVWADIGLRPRAAVLPPGDRTVPLNSCYAVRCGMEEDAWALAALLNSAVAAAWLNAIAEPARGGYRRYLGWTVGLLPVPRNWPRARKALAAAARLRDDATLAAAVLEAYGIAERDVAALLAESQ